METEKNYLMVGVFVLATSVAAILFAVWLTGIGNENDYRLYRIRFSDSVNGLIVGGPVKFRGVEIGNVDDISIDPADSRLIRVDVRIKRDVPVKTDTLASLNLQGITGNAYVDLASGRPGSPNLIDTTPEGQIPEIRAESSGFQAIVNRLPELLDKISQIADQFSKVMSDENVTAVSGMMQHFSNVAAALDGQTQQMQALLQNAGQFAGDLSEITRGSKNDIRQLTANLNQATQSLNELVGRTNKASGGTYEELYQLQLELKNATRDIRTLAKSLEANPARLITPEKEKGVPAP